MNPSIPNEFEASWLTVNGLQVRAYALGSGEPLVLLHGGGVDGALLSWRLAMPALAAHRRVIAFDWPGYGESQPNPNRNTMDFYIEFTGALLDALALQRCGLMGLSLGGGAALGFALAHPERVERLALVDAYGLAEKVAFQRLSHWMVQSDWLMRGSYALLRKSRALTRWTLSYILARKESITDELVDEVFQVIRDPNAGEAFLDIQRTDVLPNRVRTCFIDRVNELSMPTLIIHGEKDTLVPLSAAREAVRRNPAIQLSVLPRCGHWPQRDAPEEFNRTAAAFFDD
jgi:pimeloyl-ACP methyl ester carboxylesterase